MKRILFCAGVLLLLLTTGFSQSQIGVKLGFYHGEVKEAHKETFPDLTEGGQRAHFFRQPQLGVWYLIPVSEKISIQSELLWVHKVWDISEELSILQGVFLITYRCPLRLTIA